jgi:hypothetical protein
MFLINKFTKTLLILILLVIIIWGGFAIHISNLRHEQFFFFRIIDPKDNSNIEIQNSFKGDTNLSDTQFFQNWCEKNYTGGKLNDERIRTMYGKGAWGEYNKTYQYFNYISTSVGKVNNTISCNAYKTIDPKEINFPVIQVFVDSDNVLMKKGTEEEVCRRQLKTIDKRVSVDTKIKMLKLKNSNLTACEIEMS